METLLYYPSFEILNENWLKFALLYINKLKPIIPERGDKHISEYFKRLYNESDLLEKYRPNSTEAYQASLDAIDIIDKILSNPQRYSPTFNTSQIDAVWQNPQKYNYTLFEDKYTSDLELFILKNKLGEKTSQGIKVSRELGFIYMTLIAQAISDAHSISPITDIKDMDRFSIFVRHKNQSEKEKFIVAQKILELKLPENIESIPINKILTLREKKDFKDKLKAFHTSLKNFLESDDDDKSTENFVKIHKHIYNEFNKKLAQLGLGLASFGIGIWITTHSQESSSQEIAQKFLEGGTYMLSGVAISKSWANTKTKRYCNKYLADLTKLGKA